MSARGSSSSGDKAVTLDIQILGRDYKVACQPQERGLHQKIVVVRHAVADDKAGAQI